jgi:hypothetical protein
VAAGLVGVVFALLLYLGILAEVSWKSSMSGFPMNDAAMPLVGLLALSLLAAYVVIWFRTPIGRRGRILLPASLVILGAGVIGVIVFSPSERFLAPLYSLCSRPFAAWDALLLTGVPVACLSLTRLLTTTRRLAIAYAVAVLTLGYLASDAPKPAPPRGIDDFSPALPADRESFEILMRYGRDHPLGTQFKDPNRIYGIRFVSLDKDHPDPWIRWLRANRSNIEQDWADLAPVRGWASELDHYPVIGDQTPPKPFAETVSFGPLRSYSIHAVSLAGLRALDGKGDEAISVLLPVLRMARHLEPKSRTLVRSMISRVMQGLCIRTAAFVLDRCQVSTESKIALSEALASGVGGETGATQLVTGEDAILMTLYSPEVSYNAVREILPRAESWHLLVPIIGPFVYNPNRTSALRLEYESHVLDSARNGNADEIKAYSMRFFSGPAAPSLKNAAGIFLLSSTTPAYSLVVKNYWRVEDERLALLGRVEGPTRS